MSGQTLVVDRSWDGRPLPASEHARLELCLERSHLRVSVDAAFHDDPAPPGPARSTPGLWEFEVVELFLLGAGQRYLELELGPHGHFLALRLRSRRQLEASDLGLDFRCERRGERWSGEARLAASHLPPGLFAANAYTLHGLGSERHYAAAHAVPGPAPDFHRLECFGPLRLDPARP